MKFLSYIFYRFILYHNYALNLKYQKLFAYLNICCLLILNAVSLLLFIESFVNVDILGFFLTENSNLNKFVRIPVLISPIFITILLYYNKNEKKIEEYLIKFANLDEIQSKKMNVKFLVYIIASIMLFLLSILSPLFLQ